MVNDRVGERKLMNCGVWCEITKYNGCNDVTVVFDDGKIKEKCFYSCFKDGTIGYFSKKELKNIREGEEFSNANGETYIIKEYNGDRNVIVQFNDGNKACVKTTYSNAKIGQVRNPYRKSIFGIGYLGEGSYKASRNNRKLYNCWMHMLERCYTENYHKLCPTYKDAYVCDEWHDFQNFAKWYEDNYYEIDKYESHLDKDILVKGNKVYSPETCVFVPENINSTFSGHSNNSNNLLGIKLTEANTYQARVGKKKLKTYKTLDEAFENYKAYKEGLIKDLANTYKENIPYKLYNSMISWSINIEDLKLN